MGTDSRLHTSYVVIPIGDQRSPAFALTLEAVIEAAKPFKAQTITNPAFCDIITRHLGGRDADGV